MAPAKKAAARRRPARKTEPTPEIQVNRTSTEATDQEGTNAEELTKTSDGSQAEKGAQSGVDLDEAKHFLDPDGRASAREEATRAHAARTGGGDVTTDELTLQRLEHSARTDGFKV